LLGRALLGRVSLFLSNSAFTWQRFTALNPEFRDTPHRVVHLGIGEAEPEGGRSPAGPPAALMLGRLLRGEAYKGHREVIAAWPPGLSGKAGPRRHAGATPAGSRPLTTKSASSTRCSALPGETWGRLPTCRSRWAGWQPAPRAMKIVHVIPGLTHERGGPSAV